jgi:hypothetical protein
VSRACIGFSKIKLSVFDKIEKDNPDRKAILIDPNKAPKPARSSSRWVSTARTRRSTA